MTKLKENNAVVNDDHGNVLIAPGLKVRHKKSGYEYTVDSVTKKNGRIIILLNLPETPRVEQDEVSNYSDLTGGELLHKYKIEENIMFVEPNENEEADKLAVTAEEFEKEYEVK